MSDTLKPTISPLQLRDELETMVLKELLGPGSVEEEIIESPPTRYFVGVLAPRKRAKSGAAPIVAAVVPPPAEDDDVDPDADIIDGDELALGGRDTTQDGVTDQTAAQEHAKALIPSSFGMTFSLNVEATEIQLSVAWGQYVKQLSEYLVSEKTGNPRRVWKRQPRGGKQCLILVEGPIQPISVDHNSPDVVVQGLIRKRKDHWCVTLFLDLGKMARNVAKMTQTLDGKIPVNRNQEIGYKEPFGGILNLKRSKPPLEFMRGNGHKVKSEHFARSKYKEEGTPDITPGNSGHSEGTPVMNSGRSEGTPVMNSGHSERTPVMNSEHSDVTPVMSSGHGEGTPDAAEFVSSGNRKDNPALLAIAESARRRPQVNPDVMRPIIGSRCRGRFWTAKQPLSLLKREPNGIQRWTLQPIAQEKHLVMSFLHRPNRPDQAYTTKELA